MRIVQAFVLCVGAFLAAVASAQTITLRMSYWVPPTSQPGPHFEEWAKQFSVLSGGSLVVQTFPAGQLGKPADHYDMARDGVVDIGWAVPGFQAGRFPIFAASELPFMASNNVAGIGAIDDWYREFAGKEMRDVRYCLAMSAPVSSLSFAGKKVESPEDLQGVRMRPTNTTIGRYLTSLKASVVQVPASETAQAFDRSLVDGIVFSPRLLVTFGIDKHIKYLMDMPFALSTSALVINKRKYDSLSAAHKKVVDQMCSPDWAMRIGRQWNEWEEAGRGAVTGAPGKILYKPTKEVEGKWRSAAQPLHEQWVKEANAAGIDGQKAYRELRQKLVAAGAAL